MSGFAEGAEASKGALGPDAREASLAALKATTEPGKELDILVVGAGPAGLACAIELAKLAKADGAELNIGVLEKAEALGEHCLSGAVVNPRSFRELFPDLKDADFPFRGSVIKEQVGRASCRERVYSGV